MSLARNFAHKNFKKIHRSLSGCPPLGPFLRALAYLKNNVLAPKFEKMLIKRMVNGWQKMKILDLGCGPCFKERDKRFHQVDICCVDLYPPYLEICRELGFKTLQADIREIGQYFPESSCDIIWLLDVIEHLEKQEGIKVLEQAERIARRQVIVWTPVGKVLQDRPTDGNPYQKHLSSWYKKDFEARGYKCEVLPNYHRDVRALSQKVSKKQKPVVADAMWAILLKEPQRGQSQWSS